MIVTVVVLRDGVEPGPAGSPTASESARAPAALENTVVRMDAEGSVSPTGTEIVGQASSSIAVGEGGVWVLMTSSLGLLPEMQHLDPETGAVEAVIPPSCTGFIGLVVVGGRSVWVGGGDCVAAINPATVGRSPG